MLSLDDLCKSYGGRVIFDHVSWSMNDDDRVGLVGLNGAGKTTLLKMIAGVIELDSGRLSRPQKTQVGYLAQDAPDMTGRSLIDETLSALAEMQTLDARRRELEHALAANHSGPAHNEALGEFGEVLSELERHDFYTAESRAESLLFGLGFKADDLVRDVGEFSGGIRMRVALAKLLLQRPEFLMLDEPTNHLDLEARNWLEDYLASYPGGIIMVSHDRYFLDRVTRKTVEVARGRITQYVGNYSAYLRQREERFQLELAAYQNQREEIERVEAFISRFRYQASKAKLVQSRIKQLGKVERLEMPAGSEKPPAINFPSCARSGRAVFELRGAVKRYADLTVYSGIDLVIERGARIALVGPNGSGKSTLMKMLAAIEPLSGGERILGHNVRFGYFAQDLGEGLDPRKTVLDELADSEGMTTTEIRNLLGAMLFSGDDVLKRVEMLSGGERARLALAKVLAHRTNCMLLDEPTNNLDLIAKESLLEAMRRYPGTVVIVSHDRYILNSLVTEVIEVGQGHAIRYLGNYDDYLAKKAAMEAGQAETAPARSVPAPLRREEKRAEKFATVAAAPARTLNGKVAPTDHNSPMAPGDHKLRRKQNPNPKRREQLEATIEDKEAARGELAALMNDPDFYLARKDANELIARHAALGREIDALYAELLKFDEPDRTSPPR